jgi:hypothetical protein
MRTPRETVAFYAGYFNWRVDPAERGPVAIGRDDDGPTRGEVSLWRALLRPVQRSGPQAARDPAADRRSRS